MMDSKITGEPAPSQHERTAPHLIVSNRRMIVRDIHNDSAFNYMWCNRLLSAYVKVDTSDCNEVSMELDCRYPNDLAT